MEDWLIETIVVFEWQYFNRFNRWWFWLIETIVVFELVEFLLVLQVAVGLIETIVVFEWEMEKGNVVLHLINRNNSCIWIYL